MLILDSQSMLVTSDPVAEIDAALADTATRLRAAELVGQREAVSVLAGWIDVRLDERLTLQAQANRHP